MAVGSEQTRLVVLRGNSGSGKSTVANGLRQSCGRDIAWVSQVTALASDHVGRSFFYYLDVSVDETLRRHRTRPQAAEFGSDDMRSWYRSADLLTTIREHVIPEASTLRQTIELVLRDTGLQPAELARDDGRRPAELR